MTLLSVFVNILLTPTYKYATLRSRVTLAPLNLNKPALINGDATCRERRENIMAKKTFKIGRDAKNGRFITVNAANMRKATSTVETMKKPEK